MSSHTGLIIRVNVGNLLRRCRVSLIACLIDLPHPRRREFLKNFTVPLGADSGVLLDYAPMASEHVVELNDSNFDSVVSAATDPVLVDFWAPWCAPCKMLSPLIDEIAGETAGKFKIAKVNVDDAPGVAQKFGVRSIPTLVFLKAGEKVDQVVGVLGKADIVKRLEALI